MVRHHAAKDAERLPEGCELRQYGKSHHRLTVMGLALFSLGCFEAAALGAMIAAVFIERYFHVGLG